MKGACLLGAAALCLASLGAASEPDGWQASVELQALGDNPANVPQVLVPKQSLVLKVTVWMPQNVNWYPRYPQWDMPGTTLLPLMMLSPSIERAQGQASQRGATQNYLLTPLAEGTLRLSPEAIRVYPDQADSPVLPFAPLEMQVALPDGAGSIAQFLPATALKVTQGLYLQTGDGPQQEVTADALARLQLQPGQVLERRISLEAQGIQGNQIPPLPVDADALQHQAETADLNNYGDFTGGKRTEHWFYAPGTKGTLELRPISVRWYELGTRAFKTAHLAGGEIQAATAQRVDARLQLPWRERLALLSPWWIAALLVIIALLGAVVRYRRIIGGILERGANAYRHGICGAEPYLFLQMWCCICLCGLESHRARRAFQYWQLRANASKRLITCEAVQLWSLSQFGAGALPPPPRLSVLRELLVLRCRCSLRGSTANWQKYSLPELRNVSAAGSTASGPERVKHPYKPLL